MSRRQPLPDLDTMTGDLLELLAELDAPPLVAPQAYTTELYPVAEFESSREAWSKTRGRLGISTRYPGWIRNSFDYQTSASGHSLSILEAVVPLTEVDPEQPRRDYDQQKRAVCEDCGWHTPIFVGRDRNLEAMWLDHAFPGWRDLPVIAESVPERPSTAADKAKYARWLARVEENEPDGWGRPGAPIITRPGDTVATRSVPGRSPWGGFDVAQLTSQLERPASPTPTSPVLNPASALLGARVDLAEHLEEVGAALVYRVQDGASGWRVES